VARQFHALSGGCCQGEFRESGQAHGNYASLRIMHDGGSEFPDNIFFVATGRYVDQDPRRKSCAFPMFPLWQHMHAEPGQPETVASR
jgi:hypothetical protein